VPAREETEVAALAGGSGVLGDVLRELGEVGALLHLGEDVLGLRPCGGARLLVGGGWQLDQDVPGSDLLRRGEAVVAVLLVVRLDLVVGRRSEGGEVLRQVRGVPHPDARRRAIAVGVIGHPFLHVGVGHGGGLADVGGRQAHELDVHLLAVLAVAILDLGVADRHAVDDEPAHAAIHQILPHLTLELAAVTVDLQDALEQLAVEAAVLLQLRHVGDGGHHLVVADVEPEALRFVPQQRVVDQLVERLSAEVEDRQAAWRHGASPEARRELGCVSSSSWRRVMRSPCTLATTSSCCWRVAPTPQPMNEMASSA
jgi:hypothetical protein